MRENYRHLYCYLLIVVISKVLEVYNEKYPLSQVFNTFKLKVVTIFHLLSAVRLS